MIGIDTNVLVRFLVDDNESQCKRARGFLTDRTIDDPAYVSAVAIAQTVWVLRRSFEFPMPAILEALRALLAADSLLIEHAEELDALINADSPPKSDLADYLIAWSGAAAGCRKTVTFDLKAARSVPEMELLQ
jgi:predicted nucleic-acid-binding protein